MPNHRWEITIRDDILYASFEIADGNPVTKTIEVTMEPSEQVPFAIKMVEKGSEDPFTVLNEVEVRLTQDEFNQLLIKLPILKQLHIALR